MSIRECIWVYHPVDPDRYLEVLQAEFGAQANPEQPGTFLVGEPALPFHQPRLVEGRLCVTGFNLAPLAVQLIEALFDHPELAPLSAVVLWTAEQSLVAHGTLAKLKLDLQPSADDEPAPAEP